MNNSMIYDSSKQPHPAWEELLGAYNYRHLIAQLIRRDVLTRYKRSVLGVAWTLLNPLGMMLVLTIAFSQIFRFDTQYGYPAFVLSGLLAWNLFSQSTTASMVNLVWGGGLLNRIYIPRSSFALAAIGTGIVNIVLATIPLILVIWISRVPFNSSFFFVPIPILLIAGFSLGVGLLISALAVYFPDVAEMYQIILTAWFYLTPIIYPKEILPEPIGYWITTFNPMYYLVNIYRMPVYYARFPTWSEFLPALIVTIVALVAGWWVFAKRSNEFAYRI